eukprot:Tamp_01200.p1 GENE.Tamp_01200~~Tamp_01200.p1  ORF type:complete len:459 (-),score=57.53 Tamp_01200:3199-4575(-)
MEEKLARRVRTCFHTVQVKEGDIVITSGENCEAFYVVHQGQIGVYGGFQLGQASGEEANSAEAVDSLVLDVNSYELHTMEEGSESGSPVGALIGATPLDFKTPLGSPLAADAHAEQHEGADIIEYIRKGVPAVFCSETGGWIQVRRRKRSQKSDPNATRMTLIKKLKRGEAFGETGLICGSPGTVTMCALCDSTLLMIGRDRLSELRLQFEQKSYYSLKTMVENTPYARHLPEEIVCKLAEAVEIKEFPDGTIVVNENMQLGSDECYTIMSGCVLQFKTKGFEDDSSKSNRVQRTGSYSDKLKSDLAHKKPSQMITEGQTFNDNALEDPKVEEDITKVHISPTYVCSGPTTCVSISRSVYKELVGRYVISDVEGMPIAPDDDMDESSPFAAIMPAKAAPKKKPLEVPRLSVPKAVKVANVPSDGAAGAPHKMRVKNDGAPARLRGQLGNTGPQVYLKC